VVQVARRVVLEHVGVEQQDRHTPDLRHPDAQRHRAAGQRNVDPQRLAPGSGHRQHRQAAKIVVGIEVLLAAVGVDRLPEVAAPVHQADADERDPQVAGGLAVIARKDPQPAGVDPEALVPAELGRQVGDRPARERGIVLVEPRRVASGQVPIELAHDVVIARHEALVLDERIPDVGLGPEEQIDGVARADPSRRIDRAEEEMGAGGPGPPEVVGEVVRRATFGMSISARGVSISGMRASAPGRL
jgi:hypothetical protein